MDRGSGRLIKRFLLGFVTFSFFVWWWNCLPEPLFNRPYSTVTESIKGQLLGARIAKDEQWRFPPSDSIPRRFETCILAFEDERFYNHPGVDLIAIFRALRENWKANRVVSGGSTLSMQCIRLARENPPRTYWEKCTEVLRALRLELRYTKKEILAFYCSQAPFGGNVVGLEAASWRYFGLAPHQLSWAECAALAVLPNAPGLIHPGRNRDIFKRKRNRLLSRLLDNKEIDSLGFRLSEKEEVPFKPKRLPDLAHHLTQRQKREMPETRLKSSLDANWQEYAQNLVDLHLQKWRGNQVNNASLLVMDLKDAAIKVYVGNTSKPKADGREIDMLNQARSTGSILKPFLYSDAMALGAYSPQSLIPDIPTRFGDFTPQNFDKKHRGATSLKNALQQSLNVPAVKVLRQMGLPLFLHRLQALGLEDLSETADFYGLSLILGGGEVRAEQMAQAYRRWIWAMQEKKADTLLDALQRPFYLGTIPTSDPASIYATLRIMEGLTRPRGWKQWGQERRIAWKTGTSYGFRDAWAIGTDGRWLVICWTGNANYEGRPDVIGVETSAPLLFQMMDYLPKSAFFEAPLDWQYPKVVCRESGFLAQENCRWRDTLDLGKAPLKNCAFCSSVYLNSAGLRSHRNCSDEELIDSSWMILSPAMAWYAQRSSLNYKAPPEWDPNCASGEEENLEFIYPSGFEVIRRSRDLEGSLGKVILEAGHRNGEAKIFWYVDEQYVGTTEVSHKLEIALSPGLHQILIMDKKGNSTQARLKVVE